MEEAKDKEENKTPNQEAEVQKEISTPKTQGGKSTLQRWIGSKLMRPKIQSEKKWFQRPEASIAGILNKIVKRDNRFHLLSSKRFEELLKKKGIDPNDEASEILSEKLNDIETRYGVQLSFKKLSKKEYRSKVSRAMSYSLPFHIKGGVLRNVPPEKSSKALSTPLSKGECPILEIEMEDTTSYTDGLKSPLLNLLFELKDRLYPAVIKYHHEDRRKPVKKILLVYLPFSTTAHELSQIYGKKVTEMQKGFYVEKKKRGPRKKRRQETEAKMRRAAKKLAMTVKGFSSKGREEQFREIARETGMSESYTWKFRPVIARAISDADKIRKIWQREKDIVVSMNTDERCKFLAKRIITKQSEFREEFLPYVEDLMKGNQE